MDIDKIKTLLIEVGHISDHYEKMANLSGENFNVFRTLNLQSSEVRMHSAILAEFLNPKGSHGQNDLFLKLFINQFKSKIIDFDSKVKDFDTKTSIAEVEKHTGVINTDYTQGGRIDILITDGKNNHIIIENKIYAYDQKNQLIRYYNFDKKALLFYLNLFGTEPNDISTDGKLESDKYTVISYSYDIIEWLEKCKKEAVSLPIIRETIVQYINLLKYLTNQTQISKMKDEIKKIIALNPDYIDSIEKCSDALQSIVSETKSQFEKIFNEKFHERSIQLKNGLSIVINWLDDADGVQFHYIVRKQEENVSNSELGKEYASVLKEIDNGFYSNPSHFGYFNPKPFFPKQRFIQLDKREILKLNTDNSYLVRFVDDLIRQEEEITAELIKRIDK